MTQSAPRSPGHPTDLLVGRSPTIIALRAQIRHLASFDALGNPFVPTVLIHGETGTGKGLIAHLLHDSGPRAAGPWVDVNCAAIPETLLEAELFGYEGGAFTDARLSKPGLFEAAARGMLFLDEIDALPLALQRKVLTAIEQKRVRRLGAVVERPVDVKLVAATQADLQGQVATGRFRADLYHRLAVVVLEIPPLRERPDDTLVLAQHFLQQYASAHGLAPRRLGDSAVAWLERYGWPGNVRELSHLMERVILLEPEAVVEAATLDRVSLPRVDPPVTVSGESAQAADEAGDEATRIHQALIRAGGNVSLASRLLGLTRHALRYRMRHHGIGRPGIDEYATASSGGGQGLAPRRQEPPQGTPAAGPLPPTPAWEQKPVAVLAVALVLPAALAGKDPSMNPGRWRPTGREPWWRRSKALAALSCSAPPGC